MKKKKILKKAAFIALALAFIAATGFSPLALEARVGICEEALGRCGMDAVLAGMMGGGHVLGVYAAGCVLGYSWCLNYY